MADWNDIIGQLKLREAELIRQGVVKKENEENFKLRYIESPSFKLMRTQIASKLALAEHKEATKEIHKSLQLKTYPLRDRLRIWLDYCHKEHVDMGEIAEDSAISKGVAEWDDDVRRYMTINLMEWFEDQLTIVLEDNTEDEGYEEAVLICEELIELGAATLEIDW
jgi:hypothetical protein